MLSLTLACWTSQHLSSHQRHLGDLPNSPFFSMAQILRTSWLWPISICVIFLHVFILGRNDLELRNFWTPFDSLSQYMYIHSLVGLQLWLGRSCLYLCTGAQAIYWWNHVAFATRPGNLNLWVLSQFQQSLVPGVLRSKLKQYNPVYVFRNVQTQTIYLDIC